MKTIKNLVYYFTQGGESGKSNVNYGIMDSIEVKKCKRCEISLPIDKFSFDNRNQRHESYCKPCKSEKVKSWRKQKQNG